MGYSVSHYSGGAYFTTGRFDDTDEAQYGATQSARLTPAHGITQVLRPSLQAGLRMLMEYRGCNTECPPHATAHYSLLELFQHAVNLAGLLFVRGLLAGQLKHRLQPVRGLAAHTC